MYCPNCTTTLNQSTVIDYTCPYCGLHVQINVTRAANITDERVNTLKVFGFTLRLTEKKIISDDNRSS